jgi:O-6-methylguanine DNA methyltransferase
MTSQISSHPKISLHIHIEGGKLMATRLFLSDHFEVTFTHESSPSLLNWLRLYAKKSPPLLPIPLNNQSPFSTQVLTALQKVPFGHTLSYKELALSSNNPEALRAIGGACHRNPFPLLIPCHRIIRSDGSLGGFALDLEIKKRLLRFEQSL